MPKVVSLLILLSLATTAHAKPKGTGKGKETVKVHMERAAKAHKDGKFDVALAELQAAHAIDPQPKLVYAIAQVYAKLDNCEQAIAHYEQFIAATKEKEKQAVAREAIAACKKKLVAAKPDASEPDEPSVFRDKKPPAEESPTAAPSPDAGGSSPDASAPAPTDTAADAGAKPVDSVEQKPQPVPRDEPTAIEPPPVVTAHSGPSSSTSKPWYRDVLGDALVIGGVGATIGSALVYGGAKNDLDEAERAPNLAGYEKLVASAERKRMYTWALAGGGIVLISAGLLRFALRSNGGEQRVAVVPVRDGGLVTWSGGF